MNANPTKAVKTLLREGIPIYAVGDHRNKVESWQTTTTAGAAMNFATIDENLSCSSDDSALSRFRRHMPAKNSYARKNIAYLLAINKQTADFLWDFDDDNIPVGNLLQNITKVVSDNEKYRFGLRGVSKKQLLNPYPTLGPDHFLYPRGFPLEEIKDKELHGGELVRMAASVPNRTVVYQSPADRYPDVDSLFRLTREFRIQFNSRFGSLTLDNRLVAPYNAQATLHRRDAFWCLYLPITVGDGLSDIFRAYISQALFRLFNFNVAFTTSLVRVDNRTSDDPCDGDMLFEKRPRKTINALLSHLEIWVKEQMVQSGTSKGAYELMVDLYSSLHRGEFVGTEDVAGINLWLKTLNEIGYQFPKRPNQLIGDEQVASPNVDRFPVFDDIFQSIAITENHWEAIGPVRSLYARMFPKYRVYTARPQKLIAGAEHCQTPFPDETQCFGDRRGIWSFYGMVQYYGYVDVARLLEHRAQQGEAVPSYIMWHHEDLMVNISTLRNRFELNRHREDWMGFQVREPAWFAEENTNVDIYTRLPELHKIWLKWERETVPVMLRMFRERPEFFRRNGTICAELLEKVVRVYTEKKSPEERPEALSDHGLTMDHFYIHRLIHRRQQADFMLTKWTNTEVLTDNLQTMLDYEVFLEHGIPIARRCAFSVEQMQKGFDRLDLTTSWTKFHIRNNVSTVAKYMDRGGVTLYHPLKLAMSQDHMSLALKFRDDTV